MKNIFKFLSPLIVFSMVGMMLLPLGLNYAEAGAPTYVININTPVSISDLTLTIDGTAMATKFAGQIEQYAVTVLDWGDGTSQELVNSNLIQNGDDFSGTWGPISHLYSTSGTYNVTVKLHHQNPNGAEGSDLAMDTEVVIVAPPNTAPIISLNGLSPLNLMVGDTYTESGATCTDVEDGLFSASVSGSVDTNTAGTYSLSYICIDNGGLSSEALTRTVNVSSLPVEEFILTYTAGPNGSIEGVSPQTVKKGENGTEVIAAPDTGYHFTNWSDGLTTPARTDVANGDVSVTANFAINQYTLKYIAGVGGSISGILNQLVDYLGSGTEVSATPDDSTYYFVSWTPGGLTTASRTDSGIVADATYTANFARKDSYVINYIAGLGGSITGDKNQTIYKDNNGTEVTAVADSGYHFVNWTPGDLTTASRIETNVQASATYTANFEVNPPTYACSDDLDNDQDGKTDYPADPGCTSNEDNDETDPVNPPTYACSDDLDNDQDGKTDYPADPGCTSNEDNDETDPVNPPTYACSDKEDNDDDGKVDTQDPGCHTDGNIENSESYDPEDNNETDPVNPPTYACSDDLDNDQDGKTDYPADPGCTSNEDNDETDPIVEPKDVCPNIDGVQESIPEGMDLDDGKCVDKTRSRTTGSYVGMSSGGQVLGAETTCGIYVDKYLRKGLKGNNSEAVKKVQTFLNDYMNAGLNVDGVFGTKTEDALKNFQTKHSDKVLVPWGLLKPTGIFYLTTQTEVNNIMCPELNLPIPTNLINFSQNPLTPKY